MPIEGGEDVCGLQQDQQWESNVRKVLQVKFLMTGDIAWPGAFCQHLQELGVLTKLSSF